MAGNVDFAAFKAPLYIAWEITHKCNAECVHCYSASGPNASRENELSTSEALRIIDELADAGLMVLAFSGGEPLLRRDWSTLVEHAVKRGLSVNIGSNGSCITERTADELKSLGVKSVTISIDSHKPDVHDRFRRCDGLFGRATRAVKLLADRKVRVVVGFTPTQLNWKDGGEVVSLAATLGAHAVNLSEYVPAGRGSIALALHPQELRHVLEEWIGLRKTYEGRMEIIWHDCRVGLIVPPGEERNYLGCGAGRLVGRILPNGDMTPCVFLPTSIGSLRNKHFTEIWSTSDLLRHFRNREGHISGNCGSCEHLNSCGGCRAVAFAYSGGDPLAGDPHCWIKSSFTLHELVGGEGLPV